MWDALTSEMTAKMLCWHRRPPGLSRIGLPTAGYVAPVLAVQPDPKAHRFVGYFGPFPHLVFALHPFPDLNDRMTCRQMDRINEDVAWPNTQNMLTLYLASLANNFGSRSRTQPNVHLITHIGSANQRLAVYFEPLGHSACVCQQLD
jgi:hypothetical protein